MYCTWRPLPFGRLAPPVVFADWLANIEATVSSDASPPPRALVVKVSFRYSAMFGLPMCNVTGSEGGATPTLLLLMLERRL